MFGRRAQFGRRLFRRLVGLVVLVSVCASFFPLPVGTVPPRGKDQSEPFPCQNRPCGCASADQCWKQCCCFTNAEKLVWAKANGVTPPQFVVDAARAESSAKVVKDEASRKKLCPHCTKSAISEHSLACHQASSKSECCSTSGRDQQHRDGEQAQPEEDSTRFVIGIEMMKCRGQGLFWNSLPWAVIPVAHVPEFQSDLGSWDRPQSAVAASIAAEPPEPPPKLA